jgi:hypothetical protein
MVKVNHRSDPASIVMTACPGEIASPSSATISFTTPSVGASSVVLANWASRSATVASLSATLAAAIARSSAVGPA